MIAQSGQSLATLIQMLAPYPVIALTQKAHEHRGIAAMRAGAQGYICVDDISVDTQDAVFDHAVQRSRLQQRLSDTDVSVLSVLSNINDGVIIVDEAGHVLEINPAARTMLGLGPRMQPDPTWEQTFCCIDESGASYRNAHELPLVRARSGEKFTNQVAIYRTPEQPDTVLSINGQGLYDGNRQLMGGVVTFRDVTEITHRTSALEKRAQYDELTGLANRSLFLKQLSRAIGRAQRKGSPLAALVIDLDRFKSVNDTFGHRVGDGVLKEAAARLHGCAREVDTLARCGGDEFVLILEALGDPAAAEVVGRRILTTFAADFQFEGDQADLSVSIGIAIQPLAGRSPSQLLEAADRAMYRVKQSGGNDYEVAAPAPGRALRII